MSLEITEQLGESRHDQRQEKHDRFLPHHFRLLFNGPSDGRKLVRSSADNPNPPSTWWSAAGLSIPEDLEDFLKTSPRPTRPLLIRPRNTDCYR